MDSSKNLQNMKQLDDSWNAQDLATFRRYHTKDLYRALAESAANARR